MLFRGLSCWILHPTKWIRVLFLYIERIATLLFYHPVANADTYPCFSCSKLSTDALLSVINILRVSTKFLIQKSAHTLRTHSCPVNLYWRLCKWPTLLISVLLWNVAHEGTATRSIVIHYKIQPSEQCRISWVGNMKNSSKLIGHGAQRLTKHCHPVWYLKCH